jgi:hypothetical protein
VHATKIALARFATVIADSKREGLRALPHFGGQASGFFANRLTPRRPRIRPYLRPFFHRADYWSVFHSIRVRQRNKPLLGTQTVNHSLLSTAEYRVRQNGEITEHPQKVHSLQEGEH